MIKKLEWDSEFFEIQVGELSYGKEVNSDLNNFDLLYVKNSNDFELKIEGFEPLFDEVKVIYQKELTAITAHQENIIAFENSKHDIDEIYELAYESGKYSRFNLDKNFKSNKFREMYNRWVDNSIKKTIADELLVLHDEGHLMGFITYNSYIDTATIGLIAVNPNFQRRGIGNKLLSHVEEKLFNKGIKKLLIPTQEVNKLACNFYEKQGYKIYELLHIKHYWKK